MGLATAGAGAAVKSTKLAAKVGRVLDKLGDGARAAKGRIAHAMRKTPCNSSLVEGDLVLSREEHGTALGYSRVLTVIVGHHESLLKLTFEVRSELAALKAAGYGFCVLEEPDPADSFDVEEYVEMLRDWGWAGSQENQPSWLPSS